MIKDFINFRDDAISLDSKLQQYISEYMGKAGLTEDRIKQEIEKSKREWLEKIGDPDYRTV